MAVERRLTGVPASGGLASGPAHRLAPPEARARVAAGPAEETAALRAALAGAGAAIAALRDGADPVASEILEFQEALIEDEDLTGPVLEAVGAGRPADAAWRARLDAEIADYAAAGDATFAARADDLRDLRDRVLAQLTGHAGPAPPLPQGAIVLAEDLTPSRFLELDRRLGGAALASGSPTSHVAILARARGLPILVGCRDLEHIADGETLLLDAEAGELLAAPSAASAARFRERLAAGRSADAAAAAAARAPAVTADGVAVRVLVNLDDPGMLDDLAPGICDGVGLTRSEFLFRDGAPDEAAQLAAYTRILAWAGGRPVTIRTLDAGGDKPIPGITVDGEANPFLGLRGLRLSLARPGPFRVQLRALARAAATGPLKVMLPMVSVPGELEAARGHLEAVLAELAAEGLDHARPPLGIMVETPAAALTAERFAADFYSIGSNDLVQYTLAVARDNPTVAGLAKPDDPAVLELIRRTVAAGQARGVEVSLCGDMASQPALAATLVRLGLRCLSVAPAAVGHVKAAITGMRSA